MTPSNNDSVEGRGAPWLVELIGPQLSGKSTTSDLLALALEENGLPAIRVETDSYIYSMFPIYAKLKVSGKFREARQLLEGRWGLLHRAMARIIQEGLARGYTVVHDHVNTRPFREGVNKELAAGAGARYLGVYVFAPLEVLRERWRSSNIPEVQQQRLEKKYAKFSRLREELDFDVVIDTSSTPPEAAVTIILSRIMPDSTLIVEPQPTKPAEARAVTPGTRPRSIGDVQVVKQGNTYFLVHMHRRYHADEVGFKILSLCDGSNTLERIAELAGTDMETVRSDVVFLRKAGMVELSGPERAVPA
jgi:predicted kinase